MEYLATCSSMVIGAPERRQLTCAFLPSKALGGLDEAPSVVIRAGTQTPRCGIVTRMARDPRTKAYVVAVSERDCGEDRTDSTAQRCGHFVAQRGMQFPCPG